MRIASHRGRGTGFADNSLEAFAAALALGASMLELDLRCTRDGHIVLAHDKHLAMLGRPDVWIVNLTHAELLRMRPASGTVPPSFAEFCERFAGVPAILDIKWRGAPSTLFALSEFVRTKLDAEQFVANCALLLWLDEHLSIACRLFPRVRIVYNRTQCARAVALAAAGRTPPAGEVGRIVSIPARIFRYPRLARRVVANLRSPQTQLMAYLPRSAEEVQLARALEVDIVMTDDFSIAPAPRADAAAATCRAGDECER